MFEMNQEYSESSDLPKWAWDSPDELTQVSFDVIDVIAAYELTPEQRKIVLERVASYEYSYEDDDNE